MILNVVAIFVVVCITPLNLFAKGAGHRFDNISKTIWSTKDYSEFMDHEKEEHYKSYDDDYSMLSDGHVEEISDGRQNRGGFFGGGFFGGSEIVHVHEHRHEYYFSEEDSPRKCVPTGQNCNGALGCCDPEDPTSPSEKNLCNPILKKCVNCRPNLGNECHPIYKDCCEKSGKYDVVCLPKNGKKPANKYEYGICKKITCLSKDGDKCDGRNKCCPGLECKTGECKKCGGRGCTATGAYRCCDSYFCDARGTCNCQKVGKVCSKQFPCCPNLACSTEFGLDLRADSDQYFDPGCVLRDHCADGTKSCSTGKVCVNDVCVGKYIKRGFSCEVDGDRRKCSGSDLCTRTCKAFCGGYYGRYCSDPKENTENCKCGRGSVCKKNRECHGNTCCFHEQGTNCRGQGRCAIRPKSWVLYLGGCMGGSNGAYTFGSSVPGVSVGGGHGGDYGSGQGFAKCPV